MEKSVQSKIRSVSLHERNKNQLMDLTLLDEVTNIQYVLKVEKEVYNRAYNGTSYIYSIIHILIIAIKLILFFLMLKFDVQILT